MKGMDILIKMLPARFRRGGSLETVMQSHRRLFIFLFGVALLGCSLLTAQETDPDELKKTTDDVLKRVVQIRGLDVRSPVKKSVRDSIEIAAYLKDLVRQEFEWFNLKGECCGASDSSRMISITGRII
jgi:hypothetical protein